MLKAIINYFKAILNKLKMSFYRLLAECYKAAKAAKNAKSSDKEFSEQIGEHVGCAVCELGAELFKNAIKLFISSWLAYFGAGMFKRILPVHAGWHHG